MKTIPAGKAGLAMFASFLTFLASVSLGQSPAAPLDPPPDSQSAPEATPLPPPVGFGPGDITPTENTDVSTVVTTGSSYDAWSGAVRRAVTDMVVPGAVSSHGLGVVRTYSSSNGTGWSMSWHWKMDFRGYGALDYMVHMPDGRTMRFASNQANPKRSSLGTKERLYSYDLNEPTGTADLQLEDGSVVHFSRVTDEPSLDRPQVDYFTAETFTDPYGLVTVLSNEAPDDSKPNEKHLTKVTDPSGRSLTFHYDNPISNKILTSITASTGETVFYGDNATSVTYADGTSAQYTFGATSYKDDTGHVKSATSLFTADDVRAQGPMRSIKYTYIDEAKFQGQIHQEQFPSTSEGGLLVSELTANNGPKSTVTTNIETRGDGPPRSFLIRKPTGKNVPLLREKSDFKGQLEKYEYDGGNYLKKITDRNGNETTFVNEQVLGRPLTVKHDEGDFATGTHFGFTTREYTYTDPSNPYYVATVKDDRNNLTIYQRELTTHRISEIDYPDGATETFQYNGFGQVTRHKRKSDAYDFAEYDGTGLLKMMWTPVFNDTNPKTQPVIIFNHYTSGPWLDKIEEVTDARGKRTTYEYDKMFDANGNQTAIPCSGRGLITKISYLDDTHEGLYPNGTSMSYVYDIYGNLLSETQDQLGETTNYTYDEYNRLKTVKLPASDAIPNQRATVYDYTPDRAAPPNAINPLSHTSNSVWKETSPSLVETTRGFDENFRLSSEKVGSQDAANAATTYFDYDANGNQTLMTDPLGLGKGDLSHTTTTTYDSRDRKIKVEPPPVPFNGVETTQWEYDPNNNITKIVRPDSTEENKTYDTMNRVITDTLPKDPGTPPVVVTTIFDYYPAGTLKTVKDAKLHVTTFTCNENDLKSLVSYPPNGQGVVDTEGYEYDENYNLLNRRITSNVYQVFKYDERNRQTRMSWHNGPTFDDTPHQWANGFYDNTYKHDAAGRLTEAANANSTVTRTWDAAGRLLTEKEAYTGAFTTPPLKYYYRQDGKVRRMYVGPGETYDFNLGYDGLARLSTLMNNFDTAIDYQYGYDKASYVKSRANNLNGTSMVYERDALHRPMQLEINLPGATFSREHYQYDKMDRITDVTRDEDAKKTTLDTTKWER